MKNKKLIAMLTLLCFLFTLMPVAALADDVATPENVAEVNGTQYETLADAIDAAAAGETIKLLADVTLADDTAIKIHGKTNITLDLNGFILSGNNNKTGSSLTSASPAGILNIIDSTVTIQDSSAAKTGTITNNNAGSSSASTIFVSNSATTTSAQLTIKDGVEINYPANSGTPIYAKGANTQVVIYDVDIKSGSTAFRMNTNSKFTIYGGTFDAATSIGDISAARLTIHGGTFTVKSGGVLPHNFTTNRDYVAYEQLIEFDDEGKEVARHKITFPDTQPTDYTARFYLKEGVVSNYSKLYLLSGNLTSFKNWIRDNTADIDYIEVNKDTELVGVTFGKTSVDSPPEDKEFLTLRVAEGAAVEFSNVKLGNFDIIIEGQGSATGKISPATNYMLKYDETTGTYTGYIDEASKVVNVTYPDGTTENFVTIKSAFNAANEYAEKGGEGAVTITLTKNMTENNYVTVNEGTEVILDLNGYTYSNNKYTFNISPITNKGTLTIQNGTFTAPLNVANNAAIRNDGGTLTIAQNATVTRTYGSANVSKSAIINNSGTIINNGTIECNVGCGVVSQGEDSVISGTGTITTTAGYGVNVQNGTITIEGGNIIGNTTAVQVTKGTLTINGGKFDVVGENKSYLLNCIDQYYEQGDADIIVNGGQFKGFNPANNGAEGSGTRFLAPGYISTPDGEGYNNVAIERDADEFIKEHLTADGSIITEATAENYEKIIGGEADWKKLSDVANDAVNERLTEANKGTSLTYLELLDDAKALKTAAEAAANKFIAERLTADSSIITAATADNYAQILDGESDWNALSADAQAAVNAKLTEANGGTSLTYAKLLADAKVLKAAADLEKAQTDAKAAIDKAATDEKAAIDAMTNLSDAEKKALKNAVDTAAEEEKKKIDAASTTDGVNDAKKAGIDAINSIAADVLKAAAEFIAEHLTADSSIITAATADNYAQIIGGETDWNALSDDAEATVNAKLTEANGGTSLTYAKLLADAKVLKAAADLEKAQTDAKAAIDKAATDEKAAIDAMASLSDAEKNDLKDAVDAAASNAKTAIKKASTVDAVNAAKKVGIDAIDLIGEKAAAADDINKAAADAKAQIDAMKKLTDEEKDAFKLDVDKAAITAKDNIAAANTIEDLNTAKNNGIKAIDAVVVKADNKANPKPSTSSGGGFSGSYNYPVNAGDVEGAKVTFSDNNAVAGETVTITVTPDAGKQVDEVIVTDAKGNVITVTKVGDNKYSFVMPAGKVNVAVTTEEIDYESKIVLQINNKNVLVDDKTITNDVAPKIVGDRTLVPIRVIVEALGGDVDWDAATRTVTIKIDGKVLKLVIDQPIPGFGQGATIMNSRTYVPIRYVAEYIGANVEWIKATQQIVILK